MADTPENTKDESFAERTTRALDEILTADATISKRRRLRIVEEFADRLVGLAITDAEPVAFPPIEVTEERPSEFIDAERRKFEAWVSEGDQDPGIVERNKYGYLRIDTDFAWIGWFGRAETAVARPEATGEREKLKADVEQFLIDCRVDEDEGYHDGGMNSTAVRKLLERVLPALAQPTENHGAEKGLFRMESDHILPAVSPSPVTGTAPPTTHPAQLSPSTAPAPDKCSIHGCKLENDGAAAWCERCLDEQRRDLGGAQPSPSTEATGEAADLETIRRIATDLGLQGKFEVADDLRIAAANLADRLRAPAPAPTPAEANLEEHASELGEVPDDICTWSCEDYDGGMWSTTCGEAVAVLGDSPSGNEFRFCPFCGRMIAEALPEASAKDTPPQADVLAEDDGPETLLQEGP